MGNVFGSRTVDVLSALRDIQWMARRDGSTGGHTAEGRAAVNEATCLLEALLVGQRMEQCRPDRIANRIIVDAQIVETESIWVDGTGVFEPTPPLVVIWEAMPFAEQVQWVCDRLHPAAHRYADGRATYATGMFNSATERLTRANVSLAVTEATRGRTWVEDGMGRQFAGRGTG